MTLRNWKRGLTRLFLKLNRSHSSDQPRRYFSKTPTAKWPELSDCQSEAYWYCVVVILRRVVNSEPSPNKHTEAEMLRNFASARSNLTLPTASRTSNDSGRRSWFYQIRTVAHFKDRVPCYKELFTIMILGYEEDAERVWFYILSM